MALHLLKLAVGVASIADLDDRIAARLAVCRAAKMPSEHIHTTRMVPKRIDELRDGGSLYWVIRGQVAARQTLADIRPFTDADGIGRCHLVLTPAVVSVMPRRCRPFQGWRYLADDVKPADLGAFATTLEMPEDMRFALRDLCLL